MNKLISACTHNATRAIAHPCSYLFLFTFSLFTLLSCPTAHAKLPPTNFYSNFEDLTFKTQHNLVFNSKVLSSRITLFNFIYTQCSSVCPLQTKVLTEIMQVLPANIKSHVTFVSVSLDPLNDTPEKLKAFTHRHHAENDNWLFISGNLNDTAKLSERLKLFGTDPKKTRQAKRPDDHTTHLWLIDAQGRLMMRYMGNPIDQTRIIHDIVQLNSLPPPK